MNHKVDDIDACLKKIIKLSEYRERCCYELEIRLVKREGFSEKAYSAASSLAKEYGILDDFRYAEFYIRNCTNCHKGIYGALKHLDFNKINYKDDADLVQLIEETKATEVQRAYDYISNRKSSSKNQFRSNMSKLIRRGFSPEISYQAVTKLLNNNYENKENI